MVQRRSLRLESKFKRDLLFEQEMHMSHIQSSFVSAKRGYLMGGLIALVLSVGACAQTSTPRTAGQAVDDSVLAVKAKTALIENKETKAHNIDLEVHQGEVQLNGFVGSAAEKAAAAATVQKVAGVHSVRNNLEIQNTARTGGEVLDDTVITTKVKAALIADSRTKGYQIEVQTNKGEVQLGGFVDSPNARKAAQEIAQSVSGVQSVTNSLEVK
jgi:hyperosmotically inducible protein